MGGRQTTAACTPEISGLVLMIHDGFRYTLPYQQSEVQLPR